MDWSGSSESCSGWLVSIFMFIKMISKFQSIQNYQISMENEIVMDIQFWFSHGASDLTKKKNYENHHLFSLVVRKYSCKKCAKTERASGGESATEYNYNMILIVHGQFRMDNDCKSFPIKH